MLSSLVVILGSRGRFLDLGYVDLACLNAGVGDPLGGSTLSRTSEIGLV